MKKIRLKMSLFFLFLADLCAGKDGAAYVEERLKNG
nr:MAG TPA: hypothetical protein [Caudoviricetes sp.]